MAAALRFEFQRVETLPRLAWCAHMRRGEKTVRVQHGPWVEAFDGFFFEGAWDGAFLEGRPDRALSVAGSGARIDGDRLVVSTPTSPQEVVYFARSGDRLVVSNSLAFALVQSADEPDPSYAGYASDFLTHAIEGIHRKGRTLVTRRGEVTMHEFANVIVGSDLSITRAEKHVARGVADYAAHVRMLEDTIEGVIENAADPARRHAFQPLATVSGGYDGAAIAALARRHGCREAVTFYSTPQSGTARLDSGKEIAERLGIEVSEYPRLAYLDRSGCCEAEFCMLPPAGDVPWAALEEQLAGRLVLAGRYGDRLWSTQDKHLPGLRCDPYTIGLSGRSATEFRLRVGHLLFNPAYALWEQGPDIRRISLSPEMQPWTLGGRYDRPIPRRILEEAGVPRSSFGQTKMAGSSSVRGPRSLSDESRRDYLRFVAAADVPTRLKWAVHLHHVSQNVHGTWDRVRRGIEPRDPSKPTRPNALPARRRASGPAGRVLLGYRRLVSPLLFHWGFEHVRRRYEVPSPDAAATTRR